MKKDANTTSYTADELRAKRRESRTDLGKLDCMTDNEHEALIAADEDERGLMPDWMRARLVLPEAKRSVNLRLEPDVIEFFKAEGKGHIARMQAVLKSYADAHRQQQGSSRRAQ